LLPEVLLKARLLVILVVFLLTQTLAAQAFQDNGDGWELVAPGIEYKLFELPTPNRAHVARLDRSNPDVTIESSIAAGKLARGSETTSAMANRYDDSLINWQKAGETEWVHGRRSQVAVAINGFYIENWYTYMPQSGQIQSGWYAKRFVAPNGDLVSSSGFAWKLDRTPFIGDCVIHPLHKQPVTFLDTEQVLFIQGVNTFRGTNSLVIYTPQYDWRTPTSGVEVEVLVEMERPAMVIPLVNYIKGYIREVRNGGPAFTIPYDHIVLSGTGEAAAALLEAASGTLGQEIRISQEIQNYVGEDCKIVASSTWTKTYTSIGGQFIFLKDGTEVDYEDYSSATTRHPRTAVAYNERYVYFIVVDGRAPGYSIGMRITDLAFFAQNYLGALWGIAEDGGGSSTMVVNGNVVNRPSDLCFKVYLPYVSNGIEMEMPLLYDPPVNFNLITSACERRTGNGLMMVVVEEPQKSNFFIPGEIVATKGTTSLRRGPGTNYDIIATVPEGELGKLLQPENKLAGIFAKGKYWWKVQFSGLGVTGWMIEDALQRTSSPMELWRHLR
jgi:hypothetical protein